MDVSGMEEDIKEIIRRNSKIIEQDYPKSVENVLTACLFENDR